MLVNPKTNDDPYAKQLVQMFGDYMQNPEPGILIVPLNYDHCLSGVKEEYPELWLEDLPGSYGVCDSVDNWKEVFASLLTDLRSFCVLFTPISKKFETERGWRWHKWGSYIGKMEPQCEYLYDEPLIEEVFVFSILELEPS